MGENENKVAEEIKKETKETINQVKETIKNTDIKNEAKETKGFLKEMLIDSFSPLKKAAEGDKNIFKKSIILIIVFTLLSLVNRIVFLFKIGGYSTFGKNISQIIISILNPIIAIIIPAIIILIMNKKTKKALTSIIATLTIASIPSSLNYIINIIDLLLMNNISLITNPIAKTLSVISFILMYVGIKEIFEIKEDKEIIKTFAIIVVLTELFSMIISNLLTIA